MLITAQGELYIRQIAKLPDGCQPMKVEDGRYIVGHSETGHHHVMDPADCDVMEGPSARNPDGMAILYAIVRGPTEVKHLRNTDTHAPTPLQPGIYEIRPAREFSPEGWRRVAD